MPVILDVVLIGLLSTDMMNLQLWFDETTRVTLAIKRTGQDILKMGAGTEIMKSMIARGSHLYLFVPSIAAS